MAKDFFTPYRERMTIATRTTALRFLPIPTDVADEARRTRRDRFGHELKLYRGQEPCRVCLKISESPEDFILLSYQPLPDRNPYAEIGPIFIHERECTPHDSDAFPEDFRPRSLVLRAYDSNGAIVDATVTAPGEAERVSMEFFENADVEELHVRHTSYTCFDFKIVRG
jgi:hypothetical protein